MQRVVERFTLVTMGAFALLGFSLGFIARDMPMAGGVVTGLPEWATAAAGCLVVATVAAGYWLFIRRTDSTWARGFAAETTGRRPDRACARAQWLRVRTRRQGGARTGRQRGPRGVDAGGRLGGRDEVGVVGREAVQTGASADFGQRAAGPREAGYVVAGSRGACDRGRLEALRTGISTGEESR